MRDKTMDQDTTRSLSKKLQRISDDSDGESFIRNHSGSETLHGFLNSLMADQGITIPDLIDSSGVSRNYIYNILSGERQNPGRDKVIAICIGLRASFTQINRALELVKHSALYPRDERDARIAIAVNQGVRTVTEVNLILEKNGLKPLDV